MVVLCHSAGFLSPANARACYWAVQCSPQHGRRPWRVSLLDFQGGGSLRRIFGDDNWDFASKSEADNHVNALARALDGAHIVYLRGAVAEDESSRVWRV